MRIRHSIRRRLSGGGKCNKLIEVRDRDLETCEGEKAYLLSSCDLSLHYPLRPPPTALIVHSKYDVPVTAIPSAAAFESQVVKVPSWFVTSMELRALAVVATCCIL